MKKHSLLIAGHRTSVSLEEPFWRALKRLADERGESVAQIVTAIDAAREGNLSSAIRLHVLRDLEDRAGLTPGITASGASQDRD